MLDGAVGADNMTGGKGNDTYLIDNIGDVINEGTDTIKSTIRKTLPANVEQLMLLPSSAALTATGNELDNLLTGNNLGNTLNGLDGNDVLIGGLGQDSLYGDAGNDTFMFNTTDDSTVTAPDIIADFVSGQDKIHLANIDANSTVAGDQAFSASITNNPNWQAFSQIGQLQFVSSTNTLYGNTDADFNTAEFAIHLNGITHITDTSFIL